MNSFIPSSWILIIQNSFCHSYPRTLDTIYIRSKKDKCNAKKTDHRYFWVLNFFRGRPGNGTTGVPTFDPVPTS